MGVPVVLSGAIELLAATSGGSSGWHGIAAARPASICFATYREKLQGPPRARGAKAPSGRPRRTALIPWCSPPGGWPRRPAISGRAWPRHRRRRVPRAIRPSMPRAEAWRPASAAAASTTARACPSCALGPAEGTSRRRAGRCAGGRRRLAAQPDRDGPLDRPGRQFGPGHPVEAAFVGGPTVPSRGGAATPICSSSPTAGGEVLTEGASYSTVLHPMPEAETETALGQEMSTSAACLASRAVCRWGAMMMPVTSSRSVMPARKP